MKVFYTRNKLSGKAFCDRVFSERFGMRDCGFFYGENGKPYLADSPYFIGISHSGDLTALAVGKCPVGLDIEQRRKRNVSAIVKRLSPEEREEDFFKLWTAKESYVKYLGGTLAHMLPSLTYSRGVLCENGVPVSAATHCFELEDYVFTLCTSERVEVETEEL